LEEATGAPADQSRLFIFVLIQYALCCVLNSRLMHHPGMVTTRHLFSLIAGFTLQYQFYGWQVIHVLVLSAMTYACMVLLPR